MDNHFISLYEACMCEEGQSELVIKCSYITVCVRSRLDVDITTTSYISVFKFKSIVFIYVSVYLSVYFRQEIKGSGSYVRNF